MRKLTIMFLLIAGASLGQIWGPGGVPVDWSGLGIEVMEADTFQVLEKLIGDTAFVSVDSLHADHWTGVNAVLSGALSADSTETDHITVGINLLMSTAYAVMDSLDVAHITGTDAVLSGPLSADSIEADHWSGINAALSAFLNADSLNITGGVNIGDSTYIDGALTTTGDVIVGSYSRNICIEAGAATLGPTSPGWVENATTGGLAFDADAEVVHLRFAIPADWDGASDMKLYIYWTPERGDALGDTETVIFRTEYRSLLWGTEAVDNGTSVSDSTLYTQSGAGADGATFIDSLTIDYDNASQPLAAGDCLFYLFYRHMTTDTYAGDAVVVSWRLGYNSIKIPR